MHSLRLTLNKNEIRVVAKLCNPGAHKNVVSVFRHGNLLSLTTLLTWNCATLNLENYIERKWTPIIEKTVPYFTGDQPSRMRTAQVWDIMKDVASGVAFIHLNKEIHRDLKSRNSTIALFVMLITL